MTPERVFASIVQVLLISNGINSANINYNNILQANYLASLFFNHSNFRPLVLSNSNDVNVTDSQKMCSTQLQEISNAIERQDIWALKLIDAWGKIPSGILYGHLMEMGNFDECLKVSTKLSNDQHLRGKYCLSNIDLERIGLSNVLVSICIPAACRADDFDFMLEKFLQATYNLTFDVAIMEQSCVWDAPIKLESLDWVAISILVVLVILLALSTLYDYFRTHSGKTLHPLLVSFSIRKNLQQLMKIQHTHIACLHGIRCLSMIWIIFIHCYLYLILSPNINAVDINDVGKILIKRYNWNFAIFTLAVFCFVGLYLVESYTIFHVSTERLNFGGLVLLPKWTAFDYDATEGHGEVLGGFSKIDFNSANEAFDFRRGGKLNILSMYVHRYLRLTPVIVITVLLFMTLFRYLGSGPVWNSFTSAYKLCNETWWATLLYVQNYAAAGKMCLGHSWYLAVDTQLYFISPIMIWVIWKWKKRGIAAVTVFGLLLVACLFSIIMLNKFSFMDIARSNGTATEIMPKIYYSTHTRTSPWITGLVFGYFLHYNNGRMTKLSKWTVLVGWTLSFALLLTVIFSWYPNTLPDTPKMGALETAFYLSLGRVAWPLALCWIVYACMNGYGGPINAFLSWSLWQLLAKLTYSMYVVHLLVITVNAARIKTNTYFSDYEVILNFWSNYGITILVATCMYLAVEAPVVNIEQHLLPRHKHTEKKTVEVADVSVSKQNLCD